MTRVLILGGTADAARLARALDGVSGVEVISSLAGRTEGIPHLPGRVRVGGFGGAEGLARFLRDEAIDRVVDATHPFAARISAQAAQACAQAAIPRLLLLRPAWQPEPGDRWVEVDGFAAAAAALPALGRRAFLTVGIGEVAAFAEAHGIHFLVRLIAEQKLPLADYRVVTGKGPFDADAEQSLMRANAIDVVVSKASGGAATYGKIAAARALGLPVLMIRRPPPPEGLSAGTIDEVLEWLRG
ncbi:MAG TPA: cobalt-precorrin-6A reductase [Magnetospirillum sp.]|nr:cobalt-precorrin-6A reductase [Magnetospirillum sp.]